MFDEAFIAIDWIDRLEIIEAECARIERGDYNQEEQLFLKNGTITVRRSLLSKTIEWKQDGVFHRDQGPAKITPSQITWFRNGQMHRSNGPATIYHDGVQEFYECWMQNERLHRVGGPAETTRFADKVVSHEKLNWFQDDRPYRENNLPTTETLKYNLWRNSDNEIHRDDAPAIEYHNGRKKWYQRGALHREDGPAIECANGSFKYYLFDKYYSKEDWIIKTNQLKLDKQNSTKQTMQFKTNSSA